MNIKWINVSSFLITTDSGVRIITDPYAYNYQPDDPPPGGSPIRPPIDEYADVITLSHGHFDHSYIWSIKGVPRLYTGGAPVEIKGVSFSSAVVHHGANRGYNNAICMEVDGIRIRHVGDIGIRKLTDEQVAQIGRVDILMTPWDNSNICMPHETLALVLDQLKPKVILPMHHPQYDDFMHARKGFTDLRNQNISELEFTAGKLPDPSEETLYALSPSYEM
jgi:L-ascorbate metabolism protein UlaG (beta-lactamase superfamily)